eukprot:gnl/Chilomastix_cuspidata/2177.p1 GENE.gnl/Chilomastix_cuspidata/2177~~gnl/Chilomastix_cuspidata/2177.p1  ORF type:complete len:1092 (+),score=297.30 gnl/Chilomastix_cuspidata/2177:53-3328(+)
MASTFHKAHDVDVPSGLEFSSRFIELFFQFNNDQFEDLKQLFFAAPERSLTVVEFIYAVLSQHDGFDRESPDISDTDILLLTQLFNLIDVPHFKQVTWEDLSTMLLGIASASLYSLAHENIFERRPVIYSLGMNSMNTPATGINYSQSGGLMFLCGEDRKCHIWSTKKLEKRSILQDAHAGVVLCALHLPFPPGFILTSGTDSVLTVWDPGSVNFQLHHLLECPQLCMTTLSAFGEFSNLVATGGTNGVIYLWKISASPCKVTLVKRLAGHQGSVTSLQYVKAHCTLASTSDDMTLRIWDATSSIVLHGHERSVTCVDYSLRTSLLITGSIDRTVCVWNPYSAAGPIAKLRGHEFPVVGVHYLDSTAEDLIASVDESGSIRIWELTAMNCLQLIPGTRSMFGTVVGSVYTRAERNLAVLSHRLLVYPMQLKRFSDASGGTFFNIVQTHFVPSVFGLLFISRTHLHVWSLLGKTRQIAKKDLLASVGELAAFDVSSDGSVAVILSTSGKCTLVSTQTSAYTLKIPSTLQKSRHRLTAEHAVPPFVAVVTGSPVTLWIPVGEREYSLVQPTLKHETTELAQVELPSAILGGEISQDETLVALFTSNTVHFLEPTTGKAVCAINSPLTPQKIVFGSRFIAILFPPLHALVLDRASLTPIALYHARTKASNLPRVHYALLLDSLRLVLCDVYGKVYLWNLSSSLAAATAPPPRPPTPPHEAFQASIGEVTAKEFRCEFEEDGHLPAGRVNGNSWGDGFSSVQSIGTCAGVITVRIWQSGSTSGVGDRINHDHVYVAAFPAHEAIQFLLKEGVSVSSLSLAPSVGFVVGTSTGRVYVVGDDLAPVGVISQKENKRAKSWGPRFAVDGLEAEQLHMLKSELARFSQSIASQRRAFLVKKRATTNLFVNDAASLSRIPTFSRPATSSDQRLMRMPTAAAFASTGHEEASSFFAPKNTCLLAPPSRRVRTSPSPVLLNTSRFVKTQRMRILKKQREEVTLPPMAPPRAQEAYEPFGRPAPSKLLRSEARLFDILRHAEKQIPRSTRVSKKWSHGGDLKKDGHVGGVSYGYTAAASFAVKKTVSQSGRVRQLLEKSSQYV